MAAKVDAMSQVEECLGEKKNFLLSGGAGSGKTSCLIESIEFIFNKLDSKAKVACITYTNVAADEIKQRAPYDGLYVSTIHEFLWNEIKTYQKNLLQELKVMCEAKHEAALDCSNIDQVTYRNYPHHKNGVISHDDVISIASKLFEKYQLLGRILSEKYDYIFIDEYQDTSEKVIEIFLKSIKENAKGKLCVGMFGDKMQSIYQSGVESSGDMSQFSCNYDTIIKKENYRSSQKIVRLINKIRDDEVLQTAQSKHTNDSSSVKFIYSEKPFCIETIRTRLDLDAKWDFSKRNGNTKILSLTHKVNAALGQFKELCNAYASNDYSKKRPSDKLFSNEPDDLAALLLRTAAILDAFQNNDYATLLSPHFIDIKIKNHTDKRKVAESLQKAISLCEKGTIDQVLQELKSSHIMDCGSLIKKYSSAEPYYNLYGAVSGVDARSMINYWQYYNDHLPFSTQHGVKGTESDNVIVILDNGKWNRYNFSRYFEGVGKSKSSVEENTKKIFYVCCSRAKNNLLVFMMKPSPKVLEQAREWFGDANVISLEP